MSRIAEARARAGHSLRIVEETETWEAEQQAAADLLSGNRPQPARRAPAPKPALPLSPVPTPAPGSSTTGSRGTSGVASSQRPTSNFQLPTFNFEPTSNFELRTSNFQTTPRWAEAAAQQRAGAQTRSAAQTSRPKEAALPAGPAIAESDLELAETVRLLFLSSRPVRSLLFCTAPGDEMTDVSWRAAEILALQSRKTVAFVEDPTIRVSSRRSRVAGDLITRIGWYPESDGREASPSTPPAADAETAAFISAVVPSNEALDDGLGGHVADLYQSFDFVIANATAPEAEDLIPLASEVDGVVVLVTHEATARASAVALVDTLRSAGVDLLGIIYVAPGTTLLPRTGREG